MDSNEASDRAMSMSFTPLELALLELFYRTFKGFGFPAVSEFRVSSRVNTGAGRLTYLAHEGLIRSPDGELWSDYSHVEMVGLEAGASCVVQIANGKAAYLELVVNGDVEWDGSEQPWTVSNPQTGAVGATWHAA
jgi:hypothetical protein